MTAHVIYTPTVLQKMISKQTSAMFFLVSQYEKNKINTMIFIDCDHDAAYRVVMSWEGGGNCQLKNEETVSEIPFSISCEGGSGKDFALHI